MYFLSKVEPLLKMDQAKYPGKILKVSNIGRLIFNLWIPKGYVMSYVGGLRYANVSLISCRQTSALKSRGYISVLWASLGVHLLRPPHERTLGWGCQVHILCGTLTIEFLDASGFWTPAITGNSLEILLSLCNWKQVKSFTCCALLHLNLC